MGFSEQQRGMIPKVEKIQGLRGGVGIVYAAQELPQIDAEIGKKTRCCPKNDYIQGGSKISPVAMLSG